MISWLARHRGHNNNTASLNLFRIGQRSFAFIDRWTATAFGLPCLLYLLTLAPTVYNLDSAELTTATATGGLVRATGYPLYLLLGYLWSWLPVGDIGYRLNLFSAFNGALTIAITERILRRWVIGPWATFGALGLLACAPYFWALSLIAEVYTLHTALMATLILLLLRWADDPRPYRLTWVGLVIGLSLGHHGSTILLIPGCVWYVVTVAPRQTFTPRVLLPALTALFIGLSSYLYLPWRYNTQPAFNYVGRYDDTGVFQPFDLWKPGGLWWLVSGRDFETSLLAYDKTELWGELGQFGVQLWSAFFAIGIGPGVVGLIVLWRRNWRLNIMLGLMFICNVGFYLGYYVLDKNTMFLPTYLIWALWLGVGYQWLLDWVCERDHFPTWPWTIRLLQGVIAGTVLVAGLWNWNRVDLSNDWSARTRGETILRDVEPGALIFGWWDTIPIIEYLQLVEGQRLDVKPINRFLIAEEDLERLIEREISRRPVYIDDPPAAWFKTMKVTSTGPLYRLQSRQ